MRRREFIAIAGGAAAWPIVARAQQARKVPLVGVLIPFEKGDEEGDRRQKAFENGLEESAGRTGKTSTLNIAGSALIATVFGTPQSNLLD